MIINEYEIINDIDTIEDFLYKNNSWLNLLKGYCENFLGENELAETILNPINIILENNKKILELNCSISDNYYKNLINRNLVD